MTRLANGCDDMDDFKCEGKPVSGYRKSIKSMIIVSRKGAGLSMTNEELAQRLKDGESALMPKLWEQTRRFFHGRAYSLFVQHRDACARAGVCTDDITQAGYFALCDAVATFDPIAGYKLLTYAKYHLMAHFRALLGIRTSKRDLLNQCASLDAAVGDAVKDAARIDFIADPASAEAFTDTEDAIFNDQLRAVLEAAINKLPDGYASAVYKRYFEGKERRDVAAEMGITPRKLQTLEGGGLRKLLHNRAIKAFRDEIISSYAYKATGFNGGVYACSRRARSKRDFRFRVIGCQ